MAQDEQKTQPSHEDMPVKMTVTLQSGKTVEYTQFAGVLVDGKTSCSSCCFKGTTVEQLTLARELSRLSDKIAVRAIIHAL